MTENPSSPVNLDIVGRWSYNKDQWKQVNTNPPNFALFENSLFFKHLELTQFELFINKLKFDEYDENVLFILKAPKQPLVEEKISLTNLNITSFGPIGGGGAAGGGGTAATTPAGPANNSSEVMAIVQNYDKVKNQFNILRLGPKLNQTCCEYFRFDSRGRLHIIIVARDSRENEILITRSFERMEDPANLQREKIKFFTTAKTKGWNEITSYPKQLIEMISIKLVAAKRFKDESNPEIEVLFSADLTNEQKQTISFQDEYQLYQHLFQFQISVGDKSWMVSRKYEEICNFSEFIRNQMSKLTYQFNYKKLPLKKLWKSFIEFQRVIIHIENIFRCVTQNCEMLNYNTIIAVLQFVQFPANVDIGVINFLEQMLSVSLRDEKSSERKFQIDESIVENSLENSYQSTDSFSTNSPEVVVAATGSESPQRALTSNPSIAVRMGQNPLLNRRTPQQRTFSISVDTELRRSSSGEVVGYKDVYNIPSSVKYMPVDMVTTPSMKKSIARSLLFSALKSGMLIIKHGRQGKPKRRILTCDAAVSVLFWLGENGQNEGEQLHDAKSISLSEVIEVREGSDIDPETSAAVLTTAAANGTITPDKLLELVKAKEELKSVDRKQAQSNLFESIFGMKEKDGILLGTSTLRRNCKPEDFNLSFSLILPDRTFDVQCLNKQDYNTLVINLRELTDGSPVGEELHSALSFNSTAPMNNPLQRKPSLKRMGSNLSPKKSVRFVDHDPVGRNKSTLTTQTSTTTSIAEDSDNESSKQRKTKDSDHIIQVGVDGNLDLLLKKSDSAAAAIASHDSYDVDDRPTPMRRGSSLRMSSTEAIQLGLMLAEQEKKYGINMYEVIKKSDEPVIEEYVKKGYTTEEAILIIFEDRFADPKSRQPVSPRRKSSLMTFDFADGKDDALIGRKSPLFPNLLQQKRKGSEKALDEKGSVYIAREVDDKDSDKSANLKMSAASALQIGLMLSQQEKAYGTNMYESLTPADEEELLSLMNAGLQSHEAALQIFQKKFHYDLNSAEPDPKDSPVVTAKAGADVPTAKSAPEKLKIIIHPAEVLNRSGSSLFPATNNVIPTSPREHELKQAPPVKGAKRLSSVEAVQLAVLLSEQEAQYGTNMYDSLTEADEPEIHAMMAQGMKMEEAVTAIFDRKYVHAQPHSRNNSNVYYHPDGSPVRGASQLSVGTNPYASPNQSNYSVPYLSPNQSMHNAPPYGVAPPPHSYNQSFISQGAHGLNSIPSNYSAHSNVSYGEAAFPPSLYYPMEGMPSPYMQQYPSQMMSPYGYMMPSPAYPPSPYLPTYPGMPSHNGNFSPMYPSPQPVMVAHTEKSSSSRSQHSSPAPKLGQSTRAPSSSQPAMLGQMDRSASTRSTSSTSPPTRVLDSPVTSGTKKLRITQMLSGSKPSKSESGRKHKCKESDIKKITEMGFSRDQAVTALIQNDNNLVMAINSLTG